ncbi:MAG TPA: hypothetical protein VF158_04295 [Longimicrobiales bacterium]
MTLYEVTPAGPRPLSLAEAARAVHRELCAALPGWRTRALLMGLQTVAAELEAAEAERDPAARRERAGDSVTDRIRELLEDRRPAADPFGHRRPRTLDPARLRVVRRDDGPGAA